MNGVDWRIVAEAGAALVLLVVLIRLTSPGRAQARTGRGPAQVITEVGVAVALATVLSVIRVFRMPQGGSVSLEMVPIFFVALRRGAGTGVLSGLVLGMIKLVLEPFVVHPVQFLMDYPLAFGVLGIAGLFPRLPVLGVFLGSAGRFLLHLVSGVVFFASYAPEGSNVWAYSAAYNASYMVPELVIAVVVILLLGTRGARGPRRVSARRL